VVAEDASASRLPFDESSRDAATGPV